MMSCWRRLRLARGGLGSCRGSGAPVALIASRDDERGVGRGVLHLILLFRRRVVGAHGREDRVRLIAAAAAAVAAVRVLKLARHHSLLRAIVAGDTENVQRNQQQKILPILNLRNHIFCITTCECIRYQTSQLIAP